MREAQERRKTSLKGCKGEDRILSAVTRSNLGSQSQKKEAAFSDSFGISLGRLPGGDHSCHVEEFGRLRWGKGIPRKKISR